MRRLLAAVLLTGCAATVDPEVAGLQAQLRALQDARIERAHGEVVKLETEPLYIACSQWQGATDVQGASRRYLATIGQLPAQTVPDEAITKMAASLDSRCPIYLPAMHQLLSEARDEEQSVREAVARERLATEQRELDRDASRRAAVAAAVAAGLQAAGRSIAQPGPKPVTIVHCEGSGSTAICSSY